MTTANPDRGTSRLPSPSAVDGAADPEATASYIPLPGAGLRGPAANPRVFDFPGPPRAAGELGWLAHYRVQSLIGEGGMALVFLAEDTQLSRPVALKIIKPEMAGAPEAQSRFMREAQATAAIKHDHIVTIYQVGQDNDVLFLAMEFLQGLSLHHWLERGRKPSMEIVLRIGREIAAGLAAAHQHGLIHRDIKPANIWLEAPSGRVKILDFGMARSERDDVQITQSGSVMGTPTYMAPEQARGEVVGIGADLFSLGCVFYRLSAGCLPFQGKSIMAVLSALSSETPRPPRELNTLVPPALETLVMRLLAKRPEDRPASAQAVVEAVKAIERELIKERQKAALLQSALREVEPGSPEQLRVNNFEKANMAAPEPGTRPGRRKWWIAASLLVMAAAAVGGFLFGPSRKDTHRIVVERKLASVLENPAAVGKSTMTTENRRLVQSETGADRLKPGDDQGVVRHKKVTTLPQMSAPATAGEPEQPASGLGQPPVPRVPGDLRKLGSPPSQVLSGDDQTGRRSPENDGSLAERSKAAHEKVDWHEIVIPDGDCKIDSDRARDRVTIDVPGAPHVLSVEIGRLNAPRALRAVRGDFEARVRVEGVFHPSGKATLKAYAPYHGAGILLWQDADNYLRLEIAAELQKGRVRRYANYELRRDGALAVSRGIKIEDGSTYLRLERRGDAFDAAFGPDGYHWTSFAPITAKLKDQLKIGVAAINTTTKPLTADLEGFALTEKPRPSAAVSASAISP